MAATRASSLRVGIDDDIFRLVLVDSTAVSDDPLVKKLFSSCRFLTKPPKSSANGVFKDANASTSGSNSIREGHVGTEHETKTAIIFARHVSRSASSCAMDHPDSCGTPKMTGSLDRSEATEVSQSACSFGGRLWRRVRQQIWPGVLQELRGLEEPSLFLEGGVEA